MSNAIATTFRFPVHWFALGMVRWLDGDGRPGASMSIAFMSISALGIVVFFHAGDQPVGGLFVGLTLVYVSELFASLTIAAGERARGFFHLAVGGWLMYLTWAVVLNHTSGYHLPL